MLKSVLFLLTPPCAVVANMCNPDDYGVELITSVVLQDCCAQRLTPTGERE